MVEEKNAELKASETVKKSSKMVGEGVGFERIRRITGGPKSLASK